MAYWRSKIGADVEVFLKDNKGSPVPVVGLLGGTKEEPKLIHCYGALDIHSAVQEDNVMPEFNIYPANDPEVLWESTNLVVSWLHKYFKKYDLELAIVPSMEFTKEQLDNPQAQHVGCSIDHNAWNLNPNPTVNPELLGNVRTAGGHIHVSFGNDMAPHNYEGMDGMVMQATVVRAFDLFLGVPSVLLDTDTRRKQYYGKAGAFRPKAYGVEYRVLSNFWIKDEKTAMWVGNQVDSAFEFINDNEHNDGLAPVEDCQKIITAINNNDAILAKELMEKYHIQLPQ